MQAVSSPSSELKRLQSDLAKTDESIQSMKDKMTRMRSELSILEVERKNISGKIHELKKIQKGIIISEHALIRYLERVMGIDMDAVRENILPDQVEGLCKSLGNGSYPVGNSHTVKVQDGVVVTVIEKV